MSGMLDVAQQTDKPQDYREQVFIGKVVVNDDPRRYHRIKVEIPDMWDEYKQEELPWCMPDHLPGGCGPTEYSQNIPETGSFVYVTFQNGDNHFPVYHGGVRDYRTLEGVLHENYPHRIGWQVNSFTEVHSGSERKRKHESKDPPTPHDVRGHHSYLDRSTNDVEYEHPTKTRIHIYPNGSVYLEIRDKRWPDGGDFRHDTDRDYRLNVGLAKSPGRPGDMYVDVVEGKLEVHVKATANIYVEGNVTLRTDGNLSATVQGNTSVSTQGNTDITSQGNITVASQQILTLSGAQAVVVSGPNFSVDAGGNMSVTGNIGSPGTIADGDGVDTA